MALSSSAFQAGLYEEEDCMARPLPPPPPAIARFLEAKAMAVMVSGQCDSTMSKQRKKQPRNMVSTLCKGLRKLCDKQAQRMSTSSQFWHCSNDPYRQGYRRMTYWHDNTYIPRTRRDGTPTVFDDELPPQASSSSPTASASASAHPGF